MTSQCKQYDLYLQLIMNTKSVHDHEKKPQISELTCRDFPKIYRDFTMITH
jgi:hypothetical protein